jgi:hypothetical protein
MIHTEQQYTEFYEIFQHNASVTFKIEDKDSSNEHLDVVLSQKLEAIRDIQEFTKKLEKAIQKAGKGTSKGRYTLKQKAKREDSTMVDERTDNNAEKGKRLKEKVPKDNKQ